MNFLWYKKVQLILRAQAGGAGVGSASPTPDNPAKKEPDMAESTSYTDGIIDIELDGKPYELIASAKAMRDINAAFGGMARAYAALQDVNTDSIQTILRAGLSRKDSDGLEDKIFKTGPQNLVLPAMQFVLMVNNGGRHPDNVVEEKEAEARPPTKKPKPSAD